MLNKNDVIEVEIIDYGTNGEGVAKIDGFTIFVSGAIKDEVCKIVITKVLKTHGFGKVIEILKKSENRAEIDCKTYPRCGGCSLRHIKYQETLNIKKEKVQNLIERNVSKELKVNDCGGMKSPFYYRNKAIYPVTYDCHKNDMNRNCEKVNFKKIENADKKIIEFEKTSNINEQKNLDYDLKNNSLIDSMCIKPGIYAKRSHVVIPFEECKIQTKISQEIAKYICENWESTIYNESLENDNIIKNDKINATTENNTFKTVISKGFSGNSINNEKTKNNINIKNNNQGVLRNIMIREGFATGEILVTLVESKFVKDAIDIEKLTKTFPNIKTVVANINSKNTNVVLSDKNIVLYGNGFIYDKIGDYTFKISPNSFYQVNPAQTKVIYETAIKEANLNKNDILCDLYSGIGTIGIFASKYVKQVYGIEIVSEAIKDANENAKLNDIQNIEFIEGDVETAFDSLLKNNVKPNAVIVDPPRRGLDGKTIQNLCKLNLEKLVYISCNPSTLARDLAILQNSYCINSITPIDNFPYSTHVETVVSLTKKC